MTQLEYMTLAAENKDRILRDHFIRGAAEEIVNKLLEFNKIKIEDVVQGILYSFRLEVIIPETPKNEDR